MGPRVYLVGCILPALLREAKSAGRDRAEAIASAINIADETLEKMQWPNGRHIEQDHYSKVDNRNDR